MTRNRLIGTIAFMMVSATMFSASAIIGVGVHYGYDNSLSMKSIYGEQTTFDNLQLTIEPSWGTAPSQYQNAGTIKGSDIPILIDRSGWARHPFDLGGKVYIDIIPFLDAIEVSANYAMWEYEGKIAYPTSITFKSTQPSDPAAPFIDRINVQYDTTALTFDGLGLSNPFIHNTPYARLNFDLTVRKYIIQFPPVLKTLKLYGGAGFSLSSPHLR